MADTLRRLRVELEAGSTSFTKGFKEAATSADRLSKSLGTFGAQQQRAAMQMSALHTQALRLNEGFGKAGSGLSAAFKSLTSGGGISGALAAIGPAGIAAAAGIGAISLVGGTAISAIKDLASQAEQWTNLAKSTGLGAAQVQQLTSFLQDAGIPAEALKMAMKELQKEIAGG